MEKVILKKRRYPQAHWDNENKCFHINGGLSFAAELFHEAPHLISCTSVYSLGEEWDLPVQVVQAMFEELPATEMN